MEWGNNNVFHQYGRTASQCYICPMTLKFSRNWRTERHGVFPNICGHPSIHRRYTPYRNQTIFFLDSQTIAVSTSHQNQERVNPDVFLRCWTNQCGNNQSRWQWVESGWKPLPKTSDVAKVCFQCSFCSELHVLSKFHLVKNHQSFQNIQNESFSKIHIFQYVYC